MKRIYILVEGQTEESFINEVITPLYAYHNIFIQPIIVSTSRGHKGGIVSYAKVKSQIIKLCRQDADAWVTTFFDLYALPNDFPSKESVDYIRINNCFQKVEFLEQALKLDINENNFIPYIMLHEFEALLFTDPEKFSDWVNDERIVDELVRIKNAFSSPEEINNSPQTAPSKRILSLIPDYNKVVQGTIIASEIGLDQMRRQCSHFDRWLEDLEKLKS